jgi:hypothetical protein
LFLGMIASGCISIAFSESANPRQANKYSTSIDRSIAIDTDFILRQLDLRSVIQIIEALIYRLSNSVDYSTNLWSLLMKVSTTDPRSICTRTLLRSALLKFALETKISNLTVQDVTGLAGLDRPLFTCTMPACMNCLRIVPGHRFRNCAEINVSQKMAFGQDPIFLKPFAEIVLRHLERHEDFDNTMLRRRGDLLFQDLFQELVSELMFAPNLNEKTWLLTSHNPAWIAAIF